LETTKYFVTERGIKIYEKDAPFINYSSNMTDKISVLEYYEEDPITYSEN